MSLILVRALSLDALGYWSGLLTIAFLAVGGLRAVVGEASLVRARVDPVVSGLGTLVAALVAGLVAALWSPGAEAALPSFARAAVLAVAIGAQDQVRYAAFAYGQDGAAVLSDAVWLAGAGVAALVVAAAPGLLLPAVLLPPLVATLAGIMTLRNVRWSRRAGRPSLHNGVQYAALASGKLAVVLVLGAHLSELGALRVAQLLAGAVTFASPAVLAAASRPLAVPRRAVAALAIAVIGSQVLLLVDPAGLVSLILNQSVSAARDVALLLLPGAIAAWGFAFAQGRLRRLERQRTLTRLVVGWSLAAAGAYGLTGVLAPTATALAATMSAVQVISAVHLLDVWRRAV